VAGHPLGHGGGSATPRPADLGVASHPLWGGSATPLFFFFFFFIELTGWPSHPLRPWGWFGHPQIGRSGGGRTTPMAQGVASHPLWGGSATPLFFFFFFIELTGWPRPPTWPKGWPATPYGMVRPPLYFYFYFFIELTGWPSHPLRPWGWFGHP
jgi:hypothetical protein